MFRPLLLGLVCVWGCNIQPATQLIVELTPEVDVARRATRVEIRVRPPQGTGGELRSLDAPWELSSDPLSIGILPLDGDASLVAEVELRLMDDLGLVLQEVRRFSFLDGALSRVPWLVTDACMTARCGEALCDPSTGECLPAMCLESIECGNGMGACAGGMRECSDGIYGECEAVPSPEASGFPDVDDDCDGRIDEMPSTEFAPPVQLTPLHQEHQWGSEELELTWSTSSGLAQVEVRCTGAEDCVHTRCTDQESASIPLPRGHYTWRVRACNEDCESCGDFPERPWTVHHQMLATDFDGDGLGDTAVLVNRDNVLDLVYLRGDGRISREITSLDAEDEGILAAAIGDVRGGLGAELALLDGNDLYIVVDDGPFPGEPEISLPMDLGEPEAIALGDFDGDGVSSIVVSFENGTCFVDNEVCSGASASSLAATDMNADGYEDLYFVDDGGLHLRRGGPDGLGPPVLVFESSEIGDLDVRGPGWIIGLRERGGCGVRALFGGVEIQWEVDDCRGSSGVVMLGLERGAVMHRDESSSEALLTFVGPDGEALLAVEQFPEFLCRNDRQGDGQEEATVADADGIREHAGPDSPESGAEYGTDENGGFGLAGWRRDTWRGGL